jgi:hypothetical protein
MVQWRSDGAELFYLALDGTLLLRRSSRRRITNVDAGHRFPFVAQVGMVVRSILAGSYVASPDGQRFRSIRLPADTGGTPLKGRAELGRRRRRRCGQSGRLMAGRKPADPRIRRHQS